jgi:Tfp pilus assembly protein PilF
VTARRFLAPTLFFILVVALAANAQTPPAGTPPATPAKPGAISAQEEKARELFTQGKFDDAFKLLQDAVKANPKLAPARVQMATLFYLAKQGQPARQNLETAAAEDPKHPDVYLLNASFAFSEGRLTDAILSCQIVLQCASEPRWDPEQRKRFIREGRLGLASSFEGRRDFVSAKDQLAALLAEEPKNGVFRTRQGVALFMTGKLEEAFADFQTAIKDDPAMELPELQMAALYSSQNVTDKAEEWLKKAVAVHGSNAKTHRSYAGWLLENGKIDEAQIYVDTAMKLDGANKETIGLRGLFLRSRKDIAAAEPIFESLVKDSPGNSFAAWNLALVLAETGDKTKITKAIELSENEVRKNPKTPEAFAVLGWCLYKSGSLDNAEKALAEAAKAGSLSRDAAYFFARILNDKGRYEDAQKILKEISTARGTHVYRADAAALLAEVEKKVPPTPTTPKK